MLAREIKIAARHIASKSDVLLHVFKVKTV